MTGDSNRESPGTRSRVLQVPGLHSHEMDSMSAPYVLHQPGREVNEFFFSTRDELDKQVSIFKSLGVYSQIWWGYGPGEVPEDWQEYGYWKPAG